MNKYLLIV